MRAMRIILRPNSLVWEEAGGWRTFSSVNTEKKVCEVKDLDGHLISGNDRPSSVLTFWVPVTLSMIKAGLNFAWITAIRIWV